jgi:hypothetical protein
MSIYEFPGTARDHLPVYDFSQVDEYHYIVELVVAQLIPTGEQLNLTLGRHNGTDGILCLGSDWLSQLDQWRLMQIISFISGVSHFRYTVRTALHPYYHQELSAHELIEVRRELADICAKRGLSWQRISNRYDKLLLRQTAMVV